MPMVFVRLLLSVRRREPRRDKTMAHKLDYGRLVQLIENVKRNTMDSGKVADFFVAYVCGNSYKKAAEMSGVIASTAKTWQHQVWKPELKEASRGVAGQRVDRKLSKIIDLALGNLEDRLVTGDPYKNGKEIDYKPVLAKDSALIAAIAYDKRALSRGEPTAIEAEMPLEERLEGLRKTFKEVAEGKPELKVVKKN